MVCRSGCWPRARHLCKPASGTAEEPAGTASQSVPPLFTESASKRGIPGNSATEPRGIPERDSDFA
jgi:hypothetical protein